MTELNQLEEINGIDTAHEESRHGEGKAVESGELTITLRRWHLYVLVMPLIFIIGLGLGYLLRGWMASAPSASAAEYAESQEDAIPVAEAEADTSNASQQVVRYDVPVDDDPILGSDQAPITIVEFSDYECPYCRQWHSEVYTQLIEDYGEQIRFVYRDFPLESIHPNANSAAQAANCAFEQGKFWEYHDLLFSMDLGLNSEAYLDYASQLELDQADFQECVESNRYAREVQADFDFAAELGVRSTPTFFVNGIAVVGAQPFNIFQQIIERELAGEIP